MPPKVKITKEHIISAACDLVRKGEAFNARSLAAALGCSTQPIFSNFETMEQVMEAVIREAALCYEELVKQEAASGLYPPYKASGMAYIRFAREERELFKLLFMRDRTAETVVDEIDDRLLAGIERSTGLGQDDAKLFHLEMWAFVHGIGVMAATGYLDLDTELVSRMLTDAFQGLLLRSKQEEQA